MKVYDLLGAEVATLVDGVQAAGHQSVLWNGTDKAGNQLESGYYVYRIATESKTETGKMLLVK